MLSKTAKHMPVDIIAFSLAILWGHAQHWRQCCEKSHLSCAPLFSHCAAEVFVLLYAIYALLVDFRKLKTALLALVATTNVFVIDLISQ